MGLNAQRTVFWPGITEDKAKRGQCRPCIRNAPSQAKHPPVEPFIPTTPFEAVVADYFEYHGMHYLVIADRLSGWTETYRVKTGTKEAGAAGLIVSLKCFFRNFWCAQGTF